MHRLLLGCRRIHEADGGLPRLKKLIDDLRHSILHRLVQCLTFNVFDRCITAGPCEFKKSNIYINIYMNKYLESGHTQNAMDEDINIDCHLLPLTNN